MNNIIPKGYIPNKTLQKSFQDSRIIYTIQVYTNGKVWWDNILDIAIHLNINSVEYTELMQSKFDCVQHDLKLYFKNKKQCKEAIEFLETIAVINKLTQ